MDAPAKTPTPADLWQQADAKATTSAARRQLYLDLLRQHGHLVPRCEHKQDDNTRCNREVHDDDAHDFRPPTLPCGYPYGRRTGQ